MMELRMERVWLHIKSMREMFFVPLFGYFVLIPLGVWALSFEPEFYLSSSISELCYLLVPFLSTWWIYLLLREYAEADGREVLILGKGTLFSAAVFCLLNTMCVLPLLWVPVGYQYQNSIYYLVIEMMIVSFFMCGLVYFLVHFTKNITISMFIIVLYCALSNYTFAEEHFSKMLGPIQLSVLQDVPYEDGSNGYVKFILAGVMFWVFGVIYARRMQ